MEIYDIVKKLIGPIEAVGEVNADAKRKVASYIDYAIHDAEEDRVSDFIVWLLSVDEKLAKRYENESSSNI